MPKKRAKKQGKKVEAKPKYAYTLTDAVFGEILVLNSESGAWWLNPTKLEQLVNAFKYDATREEACISAGITVRQLEYFMEKHPEALSAFDSCRHVAILQARESVVRQMKTDGNLAFKYLERKRPSEFAPKPPIMAVQINMSERMQAKKEKYQNKSEVAGALPPPTQEEK